MLKALSALTVVSALAAGLTLSAGIVPGGVTANASIPSQKTDRYDTAECERQGWPYYERECLKDGSRNAGRAVAVRLVSTDRIYAPATGPLPEWAAYLPATHPDVVAFTVVR